MSIKEELKKEIGPSTDFIFKDLIISKEKILLVFNETLIDTTRTNDFILRNLLKKSKKELNNLENIIPNTNIKKITKEEILNLLVKGFLIIITKNNIYAAEVRNILDRGIQAITSELSINVTLSIK